MAEIKCPMCSKPNPAELDVCQYCEARLKPLTDELARSQPPIHPGEEPTEQDTGQLEPVLPQWLRDVRQQARDSADESDESAEQAPGEEEAPQQPEEPGSLLAGLQAQSEDDDEIPDWLAGLRGEGGQTPDEEPSTEEDDDLAALKSMLGEDAPAPQEGEASELPGWISDLGAEEEADESAQAESQPSASDSDFGWNADFDSDSASQVDSAEGDTSFDTDLPDWLQGADEASKEEDEDIPPGRMGFEESSPVTDSVEAVPLASEGELPDWLASLGEEDAETTFQGDAEQPAAESATDWLSSLGEETAEAASQQDTESQAESATDWLASLGEDGTESAQKPETTQPAAEDEVPDWATSASLEGEAQPVGEGELPDWLSSLDSETTSHEEDEPAPTAESIETAQSVVDDEIPDWVSSLSTTGPEDGFQQADEDSAAVSDLPDWATPTSAEVDETAAPEEPQPTIEGDLPDWLSSLGTEETMQEENELASPAESLEPAQPAAEDEMPDWFSSMGEETAEAEQFPEPVEVPAPEVDKPADESEVVSPFVDDEGEPISTEDMESIFSMDMPDWLSDAETAGKEEAAPTAGAVPGGDLDPAELPSWVQAMRPVESVISETDGESADEQPMEEQGPLAGLRGVLPAIPGVGPSSIPKAYSIKLEASAEQQANATMLEQMLAEEEYPKPVGAQKAVLTQRILRWVIAVLLLLVVGGTIFSGTQINQMPTSVPPATKVFLEEYVQGSLPTNAPVLMIFDYSAALSGELEAAAAPLIDFIILKKAPRITLISSTPTGTGLADKFMSIQNTQASTYYHAGQEFVNLGYLPGGAAGVLAFSENPVNTKPLTTTGVNAWETPVLQGVNRLSDFALIVLITDDVETSRIWIEQTENARGDVRLVVISSAQSGPIIMPYHQSGQVDVMLTGLDDSAPIERVNSERPGMVRRYWDAYGFGLLAATALIVLGSVWSLLSGWQARRKDSGEE